MLSSKNALGFFFSNVRYWFLDFLRYLSKLFFYDAALTSKDYHFTQSKDIRIARLRDLDLLDGLYEARGRCDVVNVPVVLARIRVGEEFVLLVVVSESLQCEAYQAVLAAS